MLRARTQLPITALVRFSASMVITLFDTSNAAILINGIDSGVDIRMPLTMSNLIL